MQNGGGSSPSLRGFCHRNGALLLPTRPPDTAGAWRNKTVVDILSLTRAPLTPSPAGGRDIPLPPSWGGSPGSPPGLSSPWCWDVGVAHYRPAGLELPLPTCPSLISPPHTVISQPGEGRSLGSFAGELGGWLGRRGGSVCSGVCLVSKSPITLGTPLCCSLAREGKRLSSHSHFWVAAFFNAKSRISKAKSKAGNSPPFIPCVPEQPASLPPPRHLSESPRFIWYIMSSIFGFA